jgi:hypothetical protein
MLTFFSSPLSQLSRLPVMRTFCTASSSSAIILLNEGTKVDTAVLTPSFDSNGKCRHCDRKHISEDVECQCFTTSELPIPQDPLPEEGAPHRVCGSGP